ncbi:uncharacterized protein LOC143412952 [Maylandia zebra]|uniref:uncharacterized protein LOC143412952 n=1 Tax=Maylandia zebra TaxID=106582 RepID=UPI00403C9ABA
MTLKVSLTSVDPSGSERDAVRCRQACSAGAVGWMELKVTADVFEVHTKKKAMETFLVAFLIDLGLSRTERRGGERPDGQQRGQSARVTTLWWSSSGPCTLGPLDVWSFDLLHTCFIPWRTGLWPPHTP